jgi:hypothetical protein
MDNADKALKSFYLDAVVETLNKQANPFLAQIEKTSMDVSGKEVKKIVKVGMSNGIIANSETGDLPKSGNTKYAVFTSTLKNMYGTIEITDKALRASRNSEGAFVNLLNSEMDSLVKSASLTMGRMIFGDGSAKVGVVQEVIGSNTYRLDDVQSVVEGMELDVYNTSDVRIDSASGRRVTYVNRMEKTITLDGTNISSNVIAVNYTFYVAGSKNYEMSGLRSLFGTAPLYGLTRSTNPWFAPYTKTEVGELTENILQTALDELEQRTGDKVNFIVCSLGVRRAIAEKFKRYQHSVDTMALNGGFTALSYNGIPIVADRFCPENMLYFLNTKDFKLHQLCDWQWLEAEDGKILKQVPGKPVYTATLVKYAELICERPCAQGVMEIIE